MAFILVVDDDASDRRLYVETLRRGGFDARGVDGGKAGLEAAVSDRPALILSDIRMGTFGGLELLRRIRSNPATSAVPVVLMTAGDVPEVQRAAMEQMADDVLAKPVSPDVLVGAVNARLKRDRQFRERADRRMEQLRASVMTALPHELHTPLSVILGYSQILQTDADRLDARDVASTAGFIRDAGIRLQRLVERYMAFVELDLARRKKPGTDYSYRRVHVAAVVEKAAKRAAERQGRQDDLQMELVQARTGIPERWLERAVEELVDNACKFSPPQTDVVVSVQLTSDEGMMIAVQDGGTGLRPEQVKELGALMQFDRKGSERAGTGLGLAIVQAVADAHGGSVHFSGQADPPGFTASLRLPAYVDDRAAWKD